MKTKRKKEELSVKLLVLIVVIEIILSFIVSAIVVYSSENVDSSDFEYSNEEKADPSSDSGIIRVEINEEEVK